MAAGAKRRLSSSPSGENGNQQGPPRKVIKRPPPYPQAPNPQAKPPIRPPPFPNFEDQRFRLFINGLRFIFEGKKEGIANRNLLAALIDRDFENTEDGKPKVALYKPPGGTSDDAQEWIPLKELQSPRDPEQTYVPPEFNTESFENAMMGIPRERIKLSTAGDPENLADGLGLFT